MLDAQALQRFGGRRLLRAAGMLAAAALMARAQVALELAPFALGLFAAGVIAGEGPAALLLGCALGAFRLPLSQVDLPLLAGCALVMLGALLLDRLPATGRMAPEALAPALAAIATLLPGLIKSGLEPYRAALLLSMAAVSAVSASAFRVLLRQGAAPLRGEARAAAALVLFALLLGLQKVWGHAAFFLAALTTLVAADGSAGLGAAAGALTGMALLSGGAEAIAALSLSVAGGAAGLLSGRGRLWAAPGFVLAAGLSGLYAPTVFPGPVAPALAAGVYVAVPEKWLKALRGHLSLADEAERGPREAAAAALNHLSEAFAELAAGMENAQEADEGGALAELRGQLCDGCAGYRDCWAGEDDRAVRLLCRALSDAAAPGAAPAEDGDVPPDVARVCRRGERLPALAAEEFRALRRRRSEEGALPGGLFWQAGRALKEAAEEQRRPRRARRSLAVRWGASAASREAGTPSGDAHIARALPDGRMLLLLSDGMGSGAAARAESERAARLLWRFLAARVDPETALGTVNEMMLLRSDGDMYATVDLCLIDPARRVADFLKLAASRSLILRGGAVMAVEGSRLPLGVLEGVSPSVSRVELRPGDVILMGTDGVMESGEGRMEELLATHATLLPNELAEAALRAAEEGTSPGSRRDDRTALCARILRFRSSRDPPAD